MTALAVLFADEEVAYTGAELRSHWVYDRFGLAGDCAAAFIGPCGVRPEHMKDVEDLKAGERIYSERMLHFIIEHFDGDLDRAVLRQRLFIATMGEVLNRRLGSPRIRRQGADLYEDARKLTVSIASVSPVSALIHAGVNISSCNTPVPTRGLEDYQIDPPEFAREILAAYATECASAQHARCKARPCK